MRNISEIVKTGKCVGCGNCESVCQLSSISFSVSNGFSYPLINYDKCVNCGKCYQVCPVNEDNKTLNTPFSFYAAYAKEANMPALSTSGGVCTLLSELVINSGGVVFSVRFTDEWKAEYARADTIESLQNHIGSKYMQADNNKVQIQIADDLQSGKQVLVVGTPCFICAIIKYLDTLKINHSKLITVDFLCHGVPSPEIASAFIQSLDNKRKKLEIYNFRSKSSGWGKHIRSVKYVGEKEKSIRANYCPLQSWFGHHYSIRESCFNCDFRCIDRLSDITVADFWKIEQYYPEMPFKQGVSAVQINTVHGDNAYKELLNSGNIISKEVSSKSIWEHRKTAIMNYKKPEQYDSFWATWNKDGLNGLRKAYPPQNAWSLFKAKLKSLIR